MLSDIEIAQNAKMKHIRDVAASIGIAEDDLEFYGKYKAKIASELWGKVKDNENGKLILVTHLPKWAKSAFWHFVSRHSDLLW